MKSSEIFSLKLNRKYLSVVYKRIVKKTIVHIYFNFNTKKDYLNNTSDIIKSTRCAFLHRRNRCAVKTNSFGIIFTVTNMMREERFNSISGVRCVGILKALQGSLLKYNVSGP